MNTRFLLLASCTALACARPEPPSAYQYNVPSSPSTSYGAPLSAERSASSSSTAYAAPAPVYGAPAQAPVIHKHVYVHVPPPEPEYPAARRPIAFPPAQKHYKIVFIKAPSPASTSAPIIPVQPQNEEKTLVYVLVKRPDDQPDVVVPTAQPTQPSKPEVYFIRYKTQKQESTGPYPESIAPAPGGEYGAPASVPSVPSSSYGVPH